MSIKGAKRGNCNSIIFADMLSLFQKLDKRLEYPNCEGYADEKRIMEQTEKEFWQIFDRSPESRRY